MPELVLFCFNFFFFFNLEDTTTCLKADWKYPGDAGCREVATGESEGAQ